MLYGILPAMDDEPFNLLGVSAADWAQTPDSVQLALLSLLDIVRGQSARLRELETLVRDLQTKLGQTSRTSSKPPSSDPPSAPPAPPRPSRGRKAGGQVGHDGHQRPLAPPDQVQEPIELQPQHCPTCQMALATDLPDAAPLRRTQVWELPPLAPIITEYRQHSVCCPQCQQLVTAELPADAPPGTCGPRATALMALLRGRYRLSLDDVVEFLADVCQLPLSSASIVRGCARVSEALAPIDAAIQHAVQTQPQVNVDETSWPTETRKGWLWVAVSAIAVCFRICTGRGQDELRALLGESYRGIVGSDRLSAYKLLPNGQRQLCWSHLVRNLLGLQERYIDESGWAQQMLSQTDALFFAWHAAKDGWFDQVALQQALMPVRLAMQELLRVGSGSRYPKIASFSRELLLQWEALWTFSRVEGVEPTNNAAERALRPAVLWRKGCFGSRSAEGCRFVERLLSVRATCAQQERALFAFITAAVRAAWAGEVAPTLIPVPEKAASTAQITTALRPSAQTTLKSAA
jgi:transposase